MRVTILLEETREREKSQRGKVCLEIKISGVPLPRVPTPEKNTFAKFVAR